MSKAFKTQMLIYTVVIFLLGLALGFYLASLIVVSFAAEAVK